MSEAGGVFIDQLPSRVASLETDVSALKGEQSKQDTLLEAVAEGVFELRQDFEKRFDAVDKRFDAMDQRLTKLEGRVTNIEKTMVTKFEFTQLLRWLDDKFAEIDRRFAAQDTQFAEIKAILQKMNRA